MILTEWADHAWVVVQIYHSMTTELFDNDRFSPLAALAALLATFLALLYALYILAYPPKHRKPSILLLAIPVTFAFFYHEQAIPISALSDTYGRFLYIWLAHMSYEVTILEYEPLLMKENDGWRSRVREAYKVLFARNHAESAQETLFATPTHTYSRRQFLLRHTLTAVYSFFIQYLWWAFTSFYVMDYQFCHSTNMAYFFRRLPNSFTVNETWCRFSTVIHWCVINMYLYEGFHSLFAVLFVTVGLDKPSEWSMSLFGSFSEAWSVRRYWGKHWHNYIYNSFSGHTKIVTRNWLGMRRGRLETRLLENTVVFGVSGVMHSLVRWVQDGDSTDCYTIAIWYVAQMVPIVIEGIVQSYWHQQKKHLGLQNQRWIQYLERAIGYSWVIGWNMWSIPKYIFTREMWSKQRQVITENMSNIDVL